MGTLDAGRQKLDNTLSKGDAVLPETSNQGQDLIREELNMLTNDFEQFDTDISELQSTLGEHCHLSFNCVVLQPEPCLQDCLSLSLTVECLPCQISTVMFDF